MMSAVTDIQLRADILIMNHAQVYRETLTARILANKIDEY
jgi:hypothetical protein